MAIVYESTGLGAWAASSSATITKPTGLSVGDLMIAVVYGETGTITQKSGWTEVSQANNQITYSVQYRVADSADVAASNFVFNCGASGVSGGMIARVTGASTSFTTGTLSLDTASGTHTWEQPITPSANSLIFMVVGGEFAETVSGYAIVTSNPTWTERADQNTTSPRNRMAAVATAIRPEATSTGNFSASIAGSTDISGFLFSVAPQVSVSVSPAVIDATMSIQAPAVTGGATTSPAVVDLTASIQAPTVTAGANDWTNDSKNTSVWVNDSKS